MPAGIKRKEEKKWRNMKMRAIALVLGFPKLGMKTLTKDLSAYGASSAIRSSTLKNTNITARQTAQPAIRRTISKPFLISTR